MSEKKKILAVDDEVACRELLTAILEPEGFTVITAENGQEALEKAREEKPDLVVLDVMMPVLDGYDACAELKSDESTQAIPVILLTAVAEHVPTTTYSHRQGLETEADDYIAKPVKPDTLLQAVNKLV